MLPNLLLFPQASQKPSPVPVPQKSKLFLSMRSLLLKQFRGLVPRELLLVGSVEGCKPLVVCFFSLLLLVFHLFCCVAPDNFVRLDGPLTVFSNLFFLFAATSPYELIYVRRLTVDWNDGLALR